MTVRLTASDEGSSGLAATYYSLDGSRPSIATTGNVVVSTEGTTTIKYFSVDRSGNQEATKTATVRIDNFAPLSSATVAPVYYGAVHIDISAMDALSGVKEIRWSKDGGLTWNVGNAVDIPPSERGSYTLRWYAVDNAGNVEAPAHEELFAAYNRYEETASDLVYRGSWVSTSGAPWSGGAYRRSADSSAAVYLTFSGKVIELYYPTGPNLGKFRVRLDGGASQDVDLYAETPTSAKLRFTGASISNHVLAIESLNAKNASSTATAIGFDCVDVDGVVVPDTTPPSTTSNAGSGWYGQSSRITLSATDDGFVAQTLYRVGNGAVQTYSAPFAIPENGLSIPVEFRSIDGPGNNEATKTVHVKADSTPPTSTTDAQPSYIDSATVSFSATDSLSGLDRIQYNLDGNGWTDGNSVQIDGYIVHSLQYRAIDVAGNIEATQSVSVRIRRATETYTIYSPELNWYGGTWNSMVDAPDAKRTPNTYTSTYVNGYGRSTNIKVYAYKSNNSGIARVNLDGQISTVDLYAPSSIPSLTMVWDSGTLVDKNHYIAFGCNGTRNGSSLSSRVNVHSLAVEGVLGGTVTDFDPPTTQSNIPTSWVAAPFSVTLTQTDYLGNVGPTFYDVSDEATDVPDATTSYDEPFSVSREGTNYVSFYSIDTYGNAEAVNVQQLRLDSSPPTTTCDVLPVYTNSAVATLTATDGHSGVATTHFRLDNGAWAQGTTPTVPAGNAGVHTLDWYSVDAVGNREATQSATFTVLRRFEDETQSSVEQEGFDWERLLYYRYSAGIMRNGFGVGALAGTFTGDRFDLIASTGPEHGIARIVIDGIERATCDQYSEEDLYQQRVASVLGLGQGLHTFRVEWTGEKNPDVRPEPTSTSMRSNSSG